MTESEYAVFYQQISDLYGGAVNQLNGIDVPFQQALQIVTNHDDETKKEMFFEFATAYDEMASLPYLPDVLVAVQELQQHTLETQGYSDINDYIDDKGITILPAFAAMSAAAGYTITAGIS